MNEDLIEDEYCPDCGKYGHHTIIDPCKGKSHQLQQEQLEEWYDEGQVNKTKVGFNTYNAPRGLGEDKFIKSLID